MTVRHTNADDGRIVTAIVAKSFSMLPILIFSRRLTQAMRGPAPQAAGRRSSICLRQQLLPHTEVDSLMTISVAAEVDLQIFWDIFDSGIPHKQRCSRNDLEKVQNTSIIAGGQTELEVLNMRIALSEIRAL
jgi:hypothetical protein